MLGHQRLHLGHHQLPELVEVEIERAVHGHGDAGFVDAPRYLGDTRGDQSGRTGPDGARECSDDLELKCGGLEVKALEDLSCPG